MYNADGWSFLRQPFHMLIAFRWGAGYEPAIRERYG